MALWPRKLQKEPALFVKRQGLLKLLHQYIGDLNSKVPSDQKANGTSIKLNSNQVKKLAVDEEARIAIEHKAVYENVLKQRLLALKKMKVETWVKEREDAVKKASGQAQAQEPPKPVETGLTSEEEVQYLSRFTADQSGLSKFGYVTQLPTEKELEETRKALALADSYEVCDRCKTRFQVFPERRLEDGVLTTQGTCRHHWGRPIYKKGEPQKYTCCQEPVGSPGCGVEQHHVYVVKDAKRLSVVMPFIETPENDKVSPHAAVCFDCEMSYTTHGLELTRLTALSWPLHKPILDILVKPLGTVLDFNTRFSGVSKKQFLNAKPYDTANPVIDPNDLRIVDSPYKARELFCQLISPKTPVIGHAIDNDLNTIRLIHPTIIDTVLLYPHPKGLPIRFSLRVLAKDKLEWIIQQAGAAGHDSYEDARATGELVRFKIRQDWKLLKLDGWILQDGAPVPPPPVGPPPSEAAAGEKRKRDLADYLEAEDEQGAEPPHKKTQ